MNEGNPRFTQTEKVEGFRLCYLVYNNITKTLIHLLWSVFDRERSENIQK